jgi:transcriptional regulator with XRE-family HTH domain
MTAPAERRLQAAFLAATLGAPGVTQLAAAAKLGVDPSVLSRWLSGERSMPFDYALWLVEWMGGAGLAAAGAALGVEVEVRRAGRRGAEESTEEVLSDLAGHLAAQLGAIATTLRGLKGRPIRRPDRVALLADLARLEELVRLARLELGRS